MNLVSEVENELALAFLVERRHSERLDSTEIISIMNRVREVLKPFDGESGTDGTALVSGKTHFIVSN